jgi:hypothetical protein
MGEKIKEKKMSGRACSKQAPINARRAKSAEARIQRHRESAASASSLAFPSPSESATNYHHGQKEHEDEWKQSSKSGRSKTST